MTAPRRRRGAGLWARLARTTTDLDDAELAEAAVRTGADTVAGARPRTQVNLQGRLAAVTVTPTGERGWLEAELNDGTGSVRLIWIGRRTIPGVEAGRGVRVRGRIGVVDGVATIYNPAYELLP